jgi:hypothetical protein
MVRTFWGLRRFEAWDVLDLGRLVVGSFRGFGRFEAGTFWGWDVLGWDFLRLERFEAWDVL